MELSLLANSSDAVIAVIILTGIPTLSCLSNFISILIHINLIGFLKPARKLLLMHIHLFLVYSPPHIILTGVVGHLGSIQACPLICWGSVWNPPQIIETADNCKLYLGSPLEVRKAYHAYQDTFVPWWQRKYTSFNLKHGISQGFRNGPPFKLYVGIL